MKKQKTVKISTKEEAEEIFDLYISAYAELLALYNLSKDRSTHYTDANPLSVCHLPKGYVMER